MNITGLSPKQLRRAADIQERVLKFQKELSDLLGGEIPTPAADGARPAKRRRMSAKGRAAIAAAARARWAKKRGAKTATAAGKKPKKKMSAAGRRALSLAAKTRWGKSEGGGGQG